MMSNVTLKTALAPTATPSGLGMPTCAHLWGTRMPVVVDTVATTTGADVRDRGVEAFAYIPGTRAWRPPTC